jgi:hypothetical protein
MTRILGHTNPEDGLMEVSDIQRIHQGGIGMLLCRNVLEDEAKLQFVNISGTAYNDVSGKRQMPGGGV